MRLIDADKLLKDIEQYHLSDGFFQHWVEVQPTIEERKKGKWIVEGRHPNYLLRCSACQEIAMWAGGISYIYPNFCPKCGAEMENGDERFNQPTGGD